MNDNVGKKEGGREKERTIYILLSLFYNSSERSFPGLNQNYAPLRKERSMIGVEPRPEIGGARWNYVVGLSG